MYNRNYEELSKERKYYLEKLIDEFNNKAYEHDFIGLLEDSFRKEFLDPSDVNYLYIGYYLPINYIKSIINEYNQLNNKIEDLIVYIKNRCLIDSLNIYTENGKYTEEILLKRIKDIEDIDNYTQSLDNKKILKLYI